MEHSFHNELLCSELGFELKALLGTLTTAINGWNKSPHDLSTSQNVRHLVERQLREIDRVSDDLIDLAITGNPSLYSRHVRQFALPTQDFEDERLPVAIGLRTEDDALPIYRSASAIRDPAMSSVTSILLSRRSL